MKKPPAGVSEEALVTSTVSFHGALSTNVSRSSVHSVQDWSGLADLSVVGNESWGRYGNVTLLNNESLNVNGSELQPMESLVLSEGAMAALIVMYSLATVLSICGNVLVVLVFTRGRRCRTDIRPFLINLAVADLVMAIFCMPFTSTFVMMGHWIFSKPMCPIVLFFQHLSVSASVFTNMAIGTDRFLVVMYPLKSRVTTDRAKYVLLTIWLCAVALASVQFVVGRAKLVDPSVDVLVCDEDWPGGSSQRSVFTMFVLVLTYIVPLSILAMAYTVVGIKLWRRTTPGNTDDARDRHQLRTKKKVSPQLLLFLLWYV